MIKIKRLKEKLVVTLALLLFICVLYLLKTTCPIKELFGIECFGCGMTRATLSALRLDFKTAFEYHGMFWSTPLLYLFFLFDGRLFETKWLNTAVLLCIFAGFVVNWVINLLTIA